MLIFTQNLGFFFSCVPLLEPFAYLTVSEQVFSDDLPVRGAWRSVPYLVPWRENVDRPLPNYSGLPFKLPHSGGRYPSKARKLLLTAGTSPVPSNECHHIAHVPMKTGAKKLRGTPSSFSLFAPSLPDGVDPQVRGSFCCSPVLGRFVSMLSQDTCRYDQKRANNASVRGHHCLSICTWSMYGNVWSEGWR